MTRHRNGYPKETIARLQRDGFNVYMCKPDSTYVIIEKGGDLAYSQYDTVFGFSVSTIHKPNRNSGTGYQIFKELGRVDPHHVLTAMRTSVPYWHRSDPAPRKYNGIDDYNASMPSFMPQFALVETIEEETEQ